MTPSFQSLAGKLRGLGIRMTKGRRSVLAALTKATKPLGAIELHTLLRRKKQAMDKASVYRELQFLAKRDIAHSVTFKDGIERYELAPESGHKHHLVCTKCKAVEDIEVGHGDLHLLEKSIGRKKKFRVQSHALEFYGLCARCM